MNIEDESWESGDPNYYIFIANDVDKARTYMPSGYQVAIHRLEHMFWGVTSTTRCIKQIRENDRILIYVAGKREHAQKFISTARIISGLCKIQKGTNYNIDSPTEDRFLVSHFCYKLDDVQTFENFVDIRDLLKKLSFIGKCKKKYGVYLQGGIVKILEKDFDLICSKSGLTCW